MARRGARRPPASWTDPVPLERKYSQREKGKEPRKIQGDPTARNRTPECWGRVVTCMGVVRVITPHLGRSPASDGRDPGGACSSPRSSPPLPCTVQGASLVTSAAGTRYPGHLEDFSSSTLLDVLPQVRYSFGQLLTYPSLRA